MQIIDTYSSRDILFINLLLDLLYWFTLLIYVLYCETCQKIWQSNPQNFSLEKAPFLVAVSKDWFLMSRVVNVTN